LATLDFTEAWRQCLDIVTSYRLQLRPGLCPFGLRESGRVGMTTSLLCEWPNTTSG